jgi:rhamnose utilization protein RhaD (predicted bifunctional aldolase and dehydrogenase)
MSALHPALEQLIGLSRALGEPERDYAILGEGNSSAAVDNDTFYVKASGRTLHNIGAADFVQVQRTPMLAMLEQEQLPDAEILAGLMAARVDTDAPKPSVETLFHAYFLTLPGVRFVGHTHPTPVNSILCAREGEALIRGRIFPDEIVCCGERPVWVPYTDPGQPLAREIRSRVDAFVEEEGTFPRVVLMQNHGLIALGGTPAEVLSATGMWVKTCRILLGTALLGGPNFLSEANVRRIASRPDEHYRRRGLRGEVGP